MIFYNGRLQPKFSLERSRDSRYIKQWKSFFIWFVLAVHLRTEDASRLKKSTL